MHAQALRNNVIAKLVPGGESSLAHLSDSELLTNTRGLVGKSNQLCAALLAHLAEVDVRGLHRTRACASLYTYCIYELRFSEDAAARRSSAAKLVKRFPLLLDAIATGELHLTGLLMIGPHLTAENLVDVLARAKFRTKKEIAKLVRELHPLPQVPDLIEPLGPLGSTPLRLNPTWQDYMASVVRVRELQHGDRPCDWVSDSPDCVSDSPDWANDASETPMGQDTNERHGAANERHGAANERHDAANQQVSSASSDAALARVEAVRAAELPPLAPQQYQLQFTATEEHVQLIERAKALLARQSPAQSLGELHLRALRLLVAALEKQKFGAPGPAATAKPDEPAERDEPAALAPLAEGPIGHEVRQTAASAPRQRGRHIPADVRRAVFERDGARCSFVDERGERCCETRKLQFHHRKAFANGGPHTLANVTLHCAAHNTLAAEADFGRERG